MGTLSMSTRAIETMIDIEIGKRIQRARKARHMTLEQLGYRIGTTWQQLRKIEVGENRCPACRLIRIADALDLPTSDLLPALADCLPAQHRSAA